MSFLSKLFGTDPESQKRAKFKELEKASFSDTEFVNNLKAAWLTSRANAYGNDGKFDEAERDLKEALQLDSNHAPTYLSLGLVYRMRGEFQRSLDILQKAPRGEGENDFHIFQQIAGTYLQQGNFEEALKWARNALAAVDNPKRLEQQKILGDSKVVAELGGGNDEENIKMLRELIADLEKQCANKTVAT